MSTARMTLTSVNPPPPEQRREPREPDGRPAWMSRGSTITNVEMVNISKSGACFLSSRPLALGTMVRLQIGHGTKVQVLDGKVVRYRERPDGMHEIGLRIETDRQKFDVKQRFPSRS